MSIDINDIYCNHWLRNDINLKDKLKDNKYDSFIYPKHKQLTSFHIKDSIHYRCLQSNNFDLYKEYLKVSNQRDHSENQFLNLRDKFNLSKMKKIKITYNYEKNKYFVLDGVHRLCLLIFKNICKDKIPLNYLEIENNNCFYFIVYDHGIDKLNLICDEIKQNNIRLDKKILMDLPTNEFNNFVFNLYKNEPYRHIKAKNDYIIQKSKEKNSVKIAILLVSLPKWNIMKVGSCVKSIEIESLKRKFRNLYNPKFPDLNKQISPLDKGVSHNHIIHSTDHPKEFKSVYEIVDKYFKYSILDLFLFFKDMKNYTIIKKDPNFPLFNVGKDDVDILCLDIKSTVDHIISVLTKNYTQYTHCFNKSNNQLDVMYIGKFIFKFDLFDSLTTMYKPYNIPTNLTKEVIDNSIIQDNMKFPLLKDELMIRQLEYNKWIKQRPDKIKHLKFIRQYPDVKYTIFKKI